MRTHFISTLDLAISEGGEAGPSRMHLPPPESALDRRGFSGTPGGQAESVGRNEKMASPSPGSTEEVALSLRGGLWTSDLQSIPDSDWMELKSWARRIGCRPLCKTSRLSLNGDVKVQRRH